MEILVIKALRHIAEDRSLLNTLENLQEHHPTLILIQESYRTPRLENHYSTVAFILPEPCDGLLTIASHHHINFT